MTSLARAQQTTAGASTAASLNGQTSLRVPHTWFHSTFLLRVDFSVVCTLLDVWLIIDVYINITSSRGLNLYCYFQGDVLNPKMELKLLQNVTVGVATYFCELGKKP